jgi:hypothetical protein
MFTQKDIERYYRYIPKDISENECWKWLGCKITGGYGYFAATNIITGKRTQLGAHRFTALIKYKVIEDGVYAMHTCDNPACCNPNHIELGDCQKNTKDAVDRGLLKPVKGEKHGRAKLTEQQAIALLKDSKTMTVTQLRAKYKLGDTTVRDILSGRRWAHLER